ncbi:MAG: hypothetical protein AMXMBFR13_28830 [Phycisphaerae bacterium]
MSMQLSAFSSDVTPPIGHPLCGGWIAPARQIVDPLFAKGIVLAPEGQEPIVLCAVDWCWIKGECHERWREVLADAAGTTPGQVSVHCVHQHDSVMADLEADRILEREGLEVRTLLPGFFEQAVGRAASAVRDSLRSLRPVTHIGTGSAAVEKVASNRRVLGPDGKVQYWRASACKDPVARSFPEGLIDPHLKCLTFYEDDQLLAALHCYATHPMSYYGQGGVSADFVGMARKSCEDDFPGAAQVYFTGCAGDIAAGKYNDGSPENRPVLAGRIHAAMKTAVRAACPEPIRSVEWRLAPVHLPMREEYDRAYYDAMMRRPESSRAEQCKGAMGLAWWDRYEAGKKIDFTCLRVNDVSMLHLPAEMFVGYQLAAWEMAQRRAGAVGTSSGPGETPGTEAGRYAGPAAAEAGRDSEPGKAGTKTDPPTELESRLGQPWSPARIAATRPSDKPPDCRTRPFVLVAAYTDNGPSYIPTADAYPQGGYEVSMARVNPKAEAVIRSCMWKLLQP